jgi:RNAse (barnase) inhibitor barstar
VTKPAIPAPLRSGAYRTPDDLVPLRECLREARGQWVEVDLGEVRTKPALLDALARAASFPAHFGHNWDALADCFQEVSVSSAAYALHLRNAAAARTALGSEWTILLEILSDAAIYGKERGTVFIAFIDDAAELPPWQ